MDALPIIKRKDEAKHGEYRTKRVILEIYGAWERPMIAQSNDEDVILGAVLKAIGSPAPIRLVRLAALLAGEPRLLLPVLTPSEAILWKRLIGVEAEPLAPNIASLVPRSNQAWGSAVKQLRGTGLLVEDISAHTWAPGEELEEIPMEGWPDGRAKMVLSVLKRRNIDEIVQQLPEAAQGWINAKAA